MLKIKDNVDLKELEKFGLKPKYDENTGEVKAYEKVGYIKGLVIEEINFKRKIRIFKWGNTAEWRVNDKYEYYDIDTLYDLIQAGLVEKVSD